MAKKKSAKAPATPAAPAYINKRIWKQAARTQGPLPDNPQARHDELKADHKSRGKDVPTASEAELRQTAIARLRRMKGTAARRGRQRCADVEETPAAAGASNWTPMGPLAIPNGQTYGGAACW